MSLANPIRPTGIGQNAAMNVFRLSFSLALSTPPQLHAWDDYSMGLAVHKIFKGTPLTGYDPGPPEEILGDPLVAGIGCSIAPSASWWPSNLVVGAEVDIASLLRGDEGFCQLSEEAPDAEEAVYFNLDYKIPSDLLDSDTVGHAVSAEYQYTGEAPAPTWQANVGTEGAPDWVSLFPGVEGSAPQPGMTVIRPCDAGEGYNGTQTYKLTIPKTGSKFAPEIWLMNYAL